MAKRTMRQNSGQGYNGEIDTTVLHRDDRYAVISFPKDDSLSTGMPYGYSVVSDSYSNFNDERIEGSGVTYRDAWSGFNEDEGRKYWTFEIKPAGKTVPDGWAHFAGWLFRRVPLKKKTTG